MRLTDSMLCPKPQSDCTSNFKYPSRRAREKLIFSADCSYQGSNERTRTRISWTWAQTLTLPGTTYKTGLYTADSVSRLNVTACVQKKFISTYMRSSGPQVVN